MANPQIEQGHTDIANDLLEALCRTHFKGNDRQVFDAIMRKTWGWKKKHDRISNTQIMKLTGLGKTRVSESIKSLLSRNMVEIVDGEIGINKDFESWVTEKRNSYGKPELLESSSSDEAVTENRNNQKVTEKRNSVTENRNPSYGNPELLLRKSVTTKEKKETNKRNLSKEKSPPKKSYADFVSMTEQEFDKLVLRFGRDPTLEMIEKLNAYKGSKGKTYKNDYLAILNWVADEVMKKAGEQVVRKDSGVDKYAGVYVT